MLLYQSTIKPTGFEEQYGSVITRNQIICGELESPVADLQASDFTSEEGDQTYFEKNLKSVMIVDNDTDCIMQVYRNDLVDPTRKSYAFSYRFKDGFEMVGIDQRIVANRFWIGKEGVDIIGREFPEIYTMTPYIFRIYGKNEKGDFIEACFTEAEDGKSLICHERTYSADKPFVKKILNKRSYTGFVRAYGNDRFVNKVKVPSKTRIFVNPEIITGKVTLDKFMRRFFPGGFAETDDRHAELWEYNPDNMRNAIDAVLQDEKHPVFQVYFLGYGFEETKILRAIVDEGFENRRKARRSARAKATNSNKAGQKRNDSRLE